MFVVETANGVCMAAEVPKKFRLSFVASCYCRKHKYQPCIQKRTIAW